MTIRNLRQLDFAAIEAQTAAVSIEQSTHGLFAIVDSASGKRLMDGFDDRMQALTHAFAHGWALVRSDAETLALFDKEV